MKWYIWDMDEDVTGNTFHIAEHGFDPDDVEAVLNDPTSRGRSDSSGNPCAWGYTPDGTYVIVIYEEIDDDTIYPITAYEVDEP